MAELFSIGRGFGAYLALSFVAIFLLFISASFAKDITDDATFQEKYNSSFPFTYQNSASSIFGSRRRTSKWRTDLNYLRPTTMPISHSKTQSLSNVSVTSFKGLEVISNSMSRSPESVDVDHQSWTMGPKNSGEIRYLSTKLVIGWNGLTQKVKQTEKIDTESAIGVKSWRKQKGVVTPATAPEKQTLPISIINTRTIFPSLDHSKAGEIGKLDDKKDYKSDYNFDAHDANENYDNGDVEEDEEDDDDDEDDDELDNKEDEYSYYNYDEDYNEKEHLKDQDEYADSEYGDSDKNSALHYAKEGNLRLPLNYSDSGNREIRRLAANGRSSGRIDVSLLVIYAWLGLLVVMVAITVIVFKYKRQLSARCLQVTSSCRKVRQVVGIEEGNNLLAHPLV